MQAVTCEFHYCAPKLTFTRFKNRDGAFGRVISDELPDNQNLTIGSCIQSCDSQNFTLAGIEFAGKDSTDYVFEHTLKLVNRPVLLRERND